MWILLLNIGSLEDLVLRMNLNIRSVLGDLAPEVIREVKVRKTVHGSIKIQNLKKPVRCQGRMWKKSSFHTTGLH